MNPKSIVKVILIAFVAVSVGWLIVQPEQGSANGDKSGLSPMAGSTASKPDAQPAVKTDRVVVYYFHNTQRCPTCHKIENYTREAVELKFEKQLKDGRMEFHSINIDEPANEHYVDDYQLHTKSVIVSDIKGGKQVRWKNLEKVWELTHDKQAFFKYIEDEVNAYLQGE